EPVLPSNATRFMSWSSGQNMPQIQIHNGGIEQETVEQVENTSDAGEEFSRIFDSSLAFKNRFNQVSHDRGQSEEQAENHRVNPIHAAHLIAEEINKADAHEHRDRQGTPKTLPGLSRADAWDHFMP